MCAGVEDKDTSVTGEFLLLCGFYFSCYLTTVKLSTVLSFVTGAEEIPPLGFPHDATLGFSETNPYPTASTCAIQFTLPSKYSVYEYFRQYILYAMVNHGGFGLS